MTRDRIRLPKLPFVFDFSVNPKWVEAYEQCKQDTWFAIELPEVQEDLQTILQSIAIIFTNCSARKLVFLTKAYMIFVHLLDTSEWDNYEDLDAKMDYLKQCLHAHETKNDRQLEELNPYFFKLAKLFREYEDGRTYEGASKEDTDDYSVDNLMKSLIESLNDIMLNVQYEHVHVTEHDELYSTVGSSTEEKVNNYLTHNISNHYDVILAKLFFNQKILFPSIEEDKTYKELRGCISKIIGIINDIYSLPLDLKHSHHDQINFIIKLSEWIGIGVSEALAIAPDYVDELLQRFDGLSKKLLEKHENSDKVRNYLYFWQRIYVAGLLFCTHCKRYSKHFNQPIKYKFIDRKFNVKSF